MKVRIHAYADRRPEFIPWQLQSFTRFLPDDFEYIVFNNAAAESDGRKINEICAQLGIRCIEVPERNGHGGPSHGRALQWSFHGPIKGEAGAIAAMIKPDLFLTGPFSIVDYLQGFDAAGISQRKGPVSYLAADLLFFDLATLPGKDEISFLDALIHGIPVEAGGSLHYWLQNHPDLRVRPIEGRIKNYRNSTGIDYYIFKTYQEVWLHYGVDCRWDRASDEYHRDKTAFLGELLQAQ
jgi:hypothetical protein